MQNCVRTYGEELSHGHLRLWRVRHGGEHVATLAVGRRGQDPLLQITQLKGPKNKDVSNAMWWVARKWLHSNNLIAITPVRSKYGTIPPDRLAWVRLWRPYWIAKRCLPAWLPLTPSTNALDELWY